MKFCFSSVWLVVRVFSASASWALADSSAPMRSRSFASRSAVSIRARICPACTVSPSRTVTWRTSPGDLRLDGRLPHRLDRARDREPARERTLDSTRARSVGANSEVDHRRGLAAGPVVLLGEAHRHAAPYGTDDERDHHEDDHPTARESLCHAYPPSRPPVRRSPSIDRPARVGRAGRIAFVVGPAWDPFPCSSRLDARRRPFGFGSA